MKIVLHPGEVTSKTDRDIHYIGVADLKELYGVRQTDTVIVDSKTEPHRSEAMYRDYLHLYPSFHGKYYNVHEKDGGTNDR